jgi:NAD(P)-dependent dehydrogenase (short-subunit alcohol dehydrogenase family)
VTRLDSKVALVIGGASGIGLAIVHRFAAEGAQVFFTGRRQADLDAAHARIGGSSQPLVADAGNLDDVKSVVDTVGDRAGRIDVLVVNAGFGEPGLVGEITEEHFDRIVGVNLRALLFAVQASLPLMSEGAAIVLIGSIAGNIGTEGYSVYGATKAGVRSLARTWTTELAPRGIRVNVVSPGPTDTAMFEAVPTEVRSELASTIPLGRLGRPDEVASAVLFLASGESSFIAGVELCVDGGLSQV